ncbi:SET and MYND domain-containing protein 5 [Armadillidium vulgare]|nr:SET and MYND domain-containing protein 5 [Armadillidium vulgare]
MTKLKKFAGFSLIQSSNVFFFFQKLKYKKPKLIKMARSKDSTITNSDFKISFIDEIKGKGLFATRNYLEGEIIFEEEPLVSCQFLWNKAYGYLACDFCMRPLENPEENVRRLTQNYELSLPYPELYENVVSRVQCSLCGVSYCCESCKEKAWNQNHEILCLRSLTPDPNHPLVLLQETWKQMHFPPETASIMLLTHIIALVRQSQEKDGILKRIMEFCHHTTNEEENIAHKLLGEEFRNQLEKLRTLWLTPDGFRSLFALVGTNGQGIGTSPFSVWVSKCENLKNISEDERKSLDIFIDDLYEKLDEGLYILSYSTPPKVIEIYDQLLDSCYKDNYVFSCKCSKCEEQKEDSDVTSEEEDSCDDDGDDEDI